MNAAAAESRAPSEVDIQTCIDCFISLQQFYDDHGQGDARLSSFMCDGAALFRSRGTSLALLMCFMEFTNRMHACVLASRSCDELLMEWGACRDRAITTSATWVDAESLRVRIMQQGLLLPLFTPPRHHE